MAEDLAEIRPLAGHAFGPILAEADPVPVSPDVKDELPSSIRDGKSGRTKAEDGPGLLAT